MTNKEQELKTLRAIEKMVEDLGENSYVGTAFEGCFEIAEDNIGNDFACSMKQRAESAESKAEEAERKVAELEKNLKFVSDSMDDWHKKAQSAIEKSFNQENKMNELRKQVNDQQKALEEKDLEIMKLKAKLYDLLITKNDR